MNMFKNFSLTRTLLDSTDTVGELLIFYLSLVAVAASVYSVAEGVSLWDATWWAFVTSTSTGYGDLYPKTIIGRLDGILLMLSAIFVIIPLIVTRLVSSTIEDRDAFTHEEQEDLKRQIVILTEALKPTNKEILS